MTQVRLIELFDYDNNTGNLLRKQSRNGQPAGKAIGFKSTGGYLQASVDGTTYMLHRLIWMYHHGQFPENEIDHDDRVKTNNKISNLIDKTTIENCQNRPLRSDNKSEFNGVCYQDHTGKWNAHIRVNKELINLGSFKTKEEAILKRKEANETYSFHKNHGGKK